MKKVNKKLNNKRLLEFQIKKSPDGLTMFFKSHRDIENFFKKAASGEVQTSRMWTDKDGNGLSFYTKSFGIIATVGAYIDDFGSTTLMSNDSPNIAILRVKGLSKGINVKLNNVLVSYSELKNWADNLVAITKLIYKEYILNLKVSRKLEVSF